jgi:hypothetical protein
MMESEHPRPAESIGSATKNLTPVDRREVVQVSFTLNGELTSGATEKYRECVQQFGLELSREIYRIEEAERAESAHEIEITTTTVSKANSVVREIEDDTLPTPSLSAQWSPKIAAITGIIAGVFGSYLNSVWQWVGCILFGALTLVLLTFEHYEIRRRS